MGGPFPTARELKDNSFSLQNKQTKFVLNCKDSIYKGNQFIQ